MRHPHGRVVNMQEVMAPLMERKRLVMTVESLVREVERLSEDNSQLRAAVGLYREVLRRSSSIHLVR